MVSGILCRCRVEGHKSTLGLDSRTYASPVAEAETAPAPEVEDASAPWCRPC